MRHTGEIFDVAFQLLRIDRVVTDVLAVHTGRFMNVLLTLLDDLTGEVVFLVQGNRASCIAVCCANGVLHTNRKRAQFFHFEIQTQLVSARLQRPAFHIQGHHRFERKLQFAPVRQLLNRYRLVAVVADRHLRQRDFLPFDMDCADGRQHTVGETVLDAEANPRRCIFKTAECVELSKQQ